MADLIRPELKAALWRWRESLGGLAVILFGVWWLARLTPPVDWVGWAFVVLGGGLAVAGVQRARFRQGGTGPGVVQVVERRLAYMGPLTGGILDMADITRLELEPKAHPAPHWVLSGVGGQDIAIPVNAEGADQLFDLFASLPGIDTARMLSVLSRTPDARVTIWQRERPLLH